MKKFILLALFMVGCATTSNFDQNTFDAVKDIKNKAIPLILAGGSYADHAVDADALRLEMSTAVAHEDGKGRSNRLSADQWHIVCDENHNSLGKFLADWKSGKNFSKAYLKDKAVIVSDELDEIVRLESAKPR